LVGLREFERTNGNGEKGSLFSMFNRIGFCGGVMCWPEDFFFQANGITANEIAGFGGLNLFS
jgi:hypothetical protein